MKALFRKLISAPPWHTDLKTSSWSRWSSLTTRCLNAMKVVTTCKKNYVANSVFLCISCILVHTLHALLHLLASDSRQCAVDDCNTVRSCLSSVCIMKTQGFAKEVMDIDIKIVGHPDLPNQKTYPSI